MASWPAPTRRGSLVFLCARLSHLSLWTFQRNQQARHFYESKGFVPVKETDGADNEEHEPDALYTWPAAAVLLASADPHVDTALRPQGERW
jgi:hypothetical protein